MDNYFPDDEYQTPRSFSQQAVEDEKMAEIIRLALQEIPVEHVDLLDVKQISNPVDVRVVQQILITEPMFTPSAILICVKSFPNAEGKERPVSWYAETELRRALLVEAEGHGLGVYYRSIYPNPSFVAQLRVALMNYLDLLPMSCLLLGYPNQSMADTLAKYESKVKREESSADYWSAGL